MAHGGARPGAGKPKGSVAKTDAKARQKAAEGGITPLEYLLQIMRDEDQPQEERKDAAKAAAPYVHARLASVDMTSKNDTTMRVLSDKPQTEDEWTNSVGLGSASGAAEVPH